MNTQSPVPAAQAADGSIKADHQDLWAGSYRGFYFKVSHWNKAASYTPGGQGNWCFYLYLREDQINEFERLWLPDTPHQLTPASPVRIDHEYMASRCADIDLHGGITFYKKHGHTDGHRTVEVGCDYAHLWDHERGGGFTIEEILYDVKQAIDSLFEKGMVKTKEATP